MNSIEFREWLRKELNERGWSQSELARRGNVTPGAISAILTGNSNPGPKSCMAIARAFNIPPENIMRKAGLEVTPKIQPRYEQINRHLQYLKEKDLEYILYIVKRLTESQ
jgi:transcriptional regulator with XRE-family HTH domain